MLGTVSPGNIHLEETLATLRYACQARAIVNRVRINEDPHDKLIRQVHNHEPPSSEKKKKLVEKLNLHPSYEYFYPDELKD